MTTINIRSKLSLPIKTSLLLFIPAVLYWQDLVIVSNEALHSDLSTHILAIPPMLVYIIYRIRKVLTANMSNQFSIQKNSGINLIKDITGILICLIAYLIKWYGSYTFYPIEYNIASLPIFVAGLTIFIFNTETLRALLVPIAFLLFLIPPPVRLTQNIGSKIASFSSLAAYYLLKILRLPVSLSSTFMSPVIYLKTPAGTQIPFAIDIACSGIYSLIGFIIFAVFTSYIAREPIYKKLVIMTLGLPLIYALNILRIIVIVIIGYISGPTLALNIFHFFGGWALILIGTLIILTISEKALNFQIFKSSSENCSHCTQNNYKIYCIYCGKLLNIHTKKISGKDIIKTAFIIAITISLLFIQVPVLALTEGAAEVFIQKSIGRQSTIKILPEIDGYDVRFVYRDIEFEKISGQNASLLFQYLPEIPIKPIWVGIEVGSTIGQLHRWEVCLISYPEIHRKEVQVKQLDLRDISLLENPPLTARYFAFQNINSNETQVILYWYTRSIFKTTEGYQQKWTKISVIQFTYNPIEYKIIEEELLPMAMTIANYWKPITNWSKINLTIATNAPTVIFITTIILFGILLFYFYQEIKIKKSVKQTYSQISNPEDLQIIDSIKVFKNEIATESKIASKYKEITGKEIDLKIISNKLTIAEQINLINKKIINLNDEPYVTWKLEF